MYNFHKARHTLVVEKKPDSKTDLAESMLGITQAIESWYECSALRIENHSDQQNQITMNSLSEYISERRATRKSKLSRPIIFSNNSSRSNIRVQLLLASPPFLPVDQIWFDIPSLTNSVLGKDFISLFLDISVMFDSQFSQVRDIFLNQLYMDVYDFEENLENQTNIDFSPFHPYSSNSIREGILAAEKIFSKRFLSNSKSFSNMFQWINLWSLSCIKTNHLDRLLNAPWEVASIIDNRWMLAMPVEGEFSISNNQSALALGKVFSSISREGRDRDINEIE